MRGKGCSVDRSTASPQIAALAREVARLARDALGKETRVIWFGSWIDGGAVDRSDLDLAVDTGRKIPPPRFARLLEKVEHLRTLRKIDLLDLRAIGEGSRRHILEEGVEL